MCVTVYSSFTRSVFMGEKLSRAVVPVYLTVTRDNGESR